MSCDVCYVISHGFSARMILHSGVIPELSKRGVATAILSPGADEPAMIELARRLKFQAVTIKRIQGRVRLIILDHARRYFFEDTETNPALKSKHQQARATAGFHPVKYALPRAFLLLQRAARRSSILAGFLRAIHHRLLSSSDVARMLSQIQPRLLVSTYPSNPLEARLLYEAKRAGIPTVCQPLSWDNITTKGEVPVSASYYLSWGPIMTQEIHDYYDAGDADVYECGVPHFDHHCRPQESAEIRAVVTHLGLDGNRPYLFFGMISPYFSPREIDLGEWLARRVRSGAFGSDMQMVVRPHPQNVQGSLADLSWLPRLDALADQRIAIDYPRLQQSKLSWSMEASDISRLAALLAGCAVCLNSGSTLSIDAVLHDRPVVITAFDAGFDFPWWQSIRRGLDYPHLAKMVRLGGVRVTRSYDELERALTDYLRDPQLDTAGRERMRKQECGACDGGASERVASALTTLLALSKPRD